MKIAILSCFYPYRGGIAQFNANLFEELGRHHDVKAFNFKRQYPDLLFPGKTQYVTPDDEAVSIESQALLDTAGPLSYGRTARAIRAWDPDILVMRYWMSWFGPSLGYVARHMNDRCRSVAILDNVIPHEPHFFDRPLTKYFLSSCDGFISMCSEVENDLLSFGTKKPHTVMPHPLYSHFGERMPREDAERALGLMPGKKNLLFFGLIRKYKGLDILLRAFDTLPDDYQLVIAGEPYGDFSEYAALIGASPARERIKLFDTYIPDSEVKFFFSASDAVVLPYRSATQSGVNALACNFGVPMIVTDTGSLRRTVEGRGTGLVVDKAEPEDVREGILSFFGTPGLREKCIESIRGEKARLSWSEFCKSIIGFTESL